MVESILNAQNFLIENKNRFKIWMQVISASVFFTATKAQKSLLPWI